MKAEGGSSLRIYYASDPPCPLSTQKSLSVGDFLLARGLLWTEGNRRLSSLLLILFYCSGA